MKDKITNIILWIISIPLGIIGALGVVSICVLISSPAEAGAGVDGDPSTVLQYIQFYNF